jgi:hypothetical protein
MIIVCAPYYCIPYVSYCSGDAVATMYSYDMLLFLDLWWGARSLYVHLIIAFLVTLLVHAPGRTQKRCPSLAPHAPSLAMQCYPCFQVLLSRFQVSICTVIPALRYSYPAFRYPYALLSPLSGTAIPLSGTHMHCYPRFQVLLSRFQVPICTAIPNSGTAIQLSCTAIPFDAMLYLSGTAISFRHCF